MRNNASVGLNNASVGLSIVFLLLNGPVIMSGLRVKNLRLLKIINVFFLQFCSDCLLSERPTDDSRGKQLTHGFSRQGLACPRRPTHESRRKHFCCLLTITSCLLLCLAPNIFGRQHLACRRKTNTRVAQKATKYPICPAANTSLTRERRTHESHRISVPALSNRQNLACQRKSDTSRAESNYLILNRL